MQRTRTWKIAMGSLLMAGTVMGAWACNEDPEEPTVKSPAVQAAAAEKTTEHLLARSEERWTHIAEGNWIEGYDYLSPTIKQWMSIYQFLEGKGNHKYDDPAKPELIAVDPEDDNVAYVQVNVKWTPLHSMIEMVDERPEDLSQRIEMVETWEWAEGDWGMRWPPERVADFYSSHPDLRKGK
jgi:hypothetical protein